MSPEMYTGKQSQILANNLKKKRLQQAQRSIKRGRLEQKMIQSILEADTNTSNSGLGYYPDFED